jgi:hypothetical protein
LVGKTAPKAVYYGIPEGMTHLTLGFINILGGVYGQEPFIFESPKGLPLLPGIPLLHEPLAKINKKVFRFFREKNNNYIENYLIHELKLPSNLENKNDFNKKLDVLNILNRYLKC